MQISVVIPTTGKNKKGLSDLLTCLSHQSILPDQIVVVLNGFQEKIDTNRYLKIIHTIEIVYQDVASLSLARTTGVNVAKHEIIAFFDDDVIIKNDYLKTALCFLANNHHILALGGAYQDKTLENRKSFSLAVGRFFCIYENGLRNKLLLSGWGDYVRGDALRRVTHADWLFGCNFVVRKKVFKKIAFEKEMLRWSYLEDLFWGARLLKEFGSCAVIHPSLIVEHIRVKSNRMISDEIICMQILHRYILWRDLIYNGNPLSFFLFCWSIIGQFLLIIKQQWGYRGVIVFLKTYWKIIKNRNLTWESVNRCIHGGTLIFLWKIDFYCQGSNLVMCLQNTWGNILT